MINSQRIQSLKISEFHGKAVLYWMNRDIRVSDNWALLHAQSLATTNKVPLLVVYNLATHFLGGGLRQVDFKIKSLQEVQKNLEVLNIPFFLIVDETGKEAPAQLLEFITKHHVGHVVTDFSPLRIQCSWNEVITKKIEGSFDVVDTHNIIPVWVASPKREFGAYTIRPKIHSHLPEFLESFPKVTSQVHLFSGVVPKIHWQKILDQVAVSDSVTPCDWVIPGESGARVTLKKFLHEKLDHYDQDRNDPNLDAQSDLSPHLHYGTIAPARVALEVLKHSGKSDIQRLMSPDRNGARKGEGNHAAFLEELIVRRELADNFCWYCSEYDSPECFPDWAKKTWEKHAHDPREFIYTKKQFEHAKTHDELWNACQMQMVKTGKMHGYMRMYWAKKILEWTPDAETAMKIAICLNDTYELDGRDPNGYAGIAWSIGGLHDRAWFERPVFGQIRYMNANGCKTKFDTKAYIAKWLGMF